MIKALSAEIAQGQHAGGIALRIKIGQENTDASFGERGAEVQGGRGFPHPALLVGDGDNLHSDRLE